MPLTEHGRYDLVFRIGDRMLRVQCKCATRKGDCLIVRLVSTRRCADGFKRTRYSREEVDLVAAYSDELDRCFLMPIEEVEGMTAFQLRLVPTKNNQVAAVNFAADYEFAGAVAQLEERVHGMHEVRGSSPLSSIGDCSAATAMTTVGSEEFGYRYARYLERASKGESFVVKRRGRPMALISPPPDATQLLLAPPPADDPAAA